jgi:hypothetical protein
LIRLWTSSNNESTHDKSTNTYTSTKWFKLEQPLLVLPHQPSWLIMCDIPLITHFTRTSILIHLVCNFFKFLFPFVCIISTSFWNSRWHLRGYEWNMHTIVVVDFLILKLKINGLGFALPCLCNAYFSWICIVTPLWMPWKTMTWLTLNEISLLVMSFLFNAFHLSMSQWSIESYCLHL